MAASYPVRVRRDAAGGRRTEAETDAPRLEEAVAGSSCSDPEMDLSDRRAKSGMKGKWAVQRQGPPGERKK